MYKNTTVFRFLLKSFCISVVPAQDLLFHLVACTDPQQDAHLTAGRSSSVLARSIPKVQRTQLKNTELFDRKDSAAVGGFSSLSLSMY